VRATRAVAVAVLRVDCACTVNGRTDRHSAMEIDDIFITPSTTDYVPTASSTTCNHVRDVVLDVWVVRRNVGMRHGRVCDTPISSECLSVCLMLQVTYIRIRRLDRITSQKDHAYSMPAERDFARIFKGARWDESTEDSIVLSLSPVTLSELKNALVMLQDRGLTQDIHGHRRRCAMFARLVEDRPNTGIFLAAVRALRTADASLRSVLVSVLPKVNDVDAHEDLCVLLGAAEIETRRAAAQILKYVGGRTAFTRTCELCQDPSFPGRTEAMDAFAIKARHGVIPLCAIAIKVGTVPERARALVHLSDREIVLKEPTAAASAILGAFSDTDERIVGRAVEAFSIVAPESEFFERIGPLLDHPSASISKSIVEGLGRYGTPRAIEILGRRFRVGPNAVRLEVLASLENIGTDVVLPVLAEALEFQQIAVRERASRVLTTLARSGKVDVARAIVWLLRSQDVNVRRTAVEVARFVEDRANTLWPRLLEMLRDEDWWVRERVMDALAEIAGEQLTRFLVGMLEDKSDVIRRFAIGALMRLKDPKCLGALVRCAMNDGDWWVRELAISAAASLGDARAAPYFIEIMSRTREARYACIEGLTTLKAREFAPQIVPLLQDEDTDVRLAVLRYVSTLEIRSASALVAPLVNDRVVRVRETALELIERWSVTDAPSSTDRCQSPLDKMLMNMVQSGADDLLIGSARVPYVKHMGRMVALGQIALSEESVRGLLFPLLSPTQRRAFDGLEDVDFSHEIKETGERFRAHIFRQMSGISAVFRKISSEIPDITTLGLPQSVLNVANEKNGLVLVGGPTGSGKSTTLAALIHHINRTTASRHIITLEDPIEAIHTRHQCLVNQREVATHTRSYATALRSALRQDPDVILVGELRDLETVEFAVTAAETGHLVLGTVHTSSSDTTVDRLVNVFPEAQQPQVRTMLAESLRAVVCQHLVPKKDGGRVLAVEVMINNDAVSNLIRKGKTFQIAQVVATSKEAGMQSMDSELLRLWREGTISTEETYLRASDKKSFETAFGWQNDSAKNPTSANPQRAPSGVHNALRASNTAGTPVRSATNDRT
jgi:twitching motility protein PilT